MLTREETRELVERMRDGDLHAREQLILDNMKLVKCYANKYCDGRIDIEDLISVGTIGLINAIDTYEPNPNVKLSTYASTCIINEIRMELRRYKNRRSKDISIETSVPGNDEIRIADTLTTEDNTQSFIEDDIPEVVVAIKKLPESDQKIIYFRYIENMNQVDLGKKLGMSQSYLSKREKKIISMIRELIA